MAQRAQLVCEHLESISSQALERFHQIVHQYVCNRYGIYAIYRRSKLYYVGLASNLHTRLGHQLKGRHGQSWDRFSVYDKKLHTSPSLADAAARKYQTCNGWTFWQNERAPGARVPLDQLRK